MNGELTVEDFELINEALEQLPKKDDAGLIAMSIFGTAFTQNNEHMKADFERELAKQKSRKESAMKLLTERIRIVQAKVLINKNKMVEDELMRQANDSVKPDTPE